MMKQDLYEALNAHLNEEAYSAYLYLSMAGYFNAINMPGMASWMNVQAQEELLHAQKFYRYIESRNHQVKLLAIQAPQHTWADPQAVFEAALGHEEHITACIHRLADLADEHRDRATQIFLQWFVTEQVEEEENVANVLERLKMLKAHPAGMLMFDNELASRSFAPSATKEA